MSNKVKNVIIACCDKEVKKILISEVTKHFGEKNVFICDCKNDMGMFTKYAKDTAIIFDKYFLGYILSYQFLRLKVINDSILTYFVEVGECSRYFGLRLHELGTNGFISEIEDSNVLKTSLMQIQTGMTIYPNVIMQSIEDEDYLLDKKCITEVTPKEMEIGLYLGMGKSQKEICFYTGLSKQAVSTHIHRLKRKIGYKKPKDYELLNQQALQGYCEEEI